MLSISIQAQSSHLLSMYPVREVPGSPTIKASFFFQIQCSIWISSGYFIANNEAMERNFQDSIDRRSSVQFSLIT